MTASPFSRVLARAIRWATRARARTRLVCGNGTTTEKGAIRNALGAALGWMALPSLSAPRLEPNANHDGNGVQEEPNGVGHQRAEMSVGVFRQA